MRRGAVDAAFAVDGPRGPYGEVKPGASLAARRSGGLLVPMGSAVARGKTFTRAWDRFVLAWPFSRVVVVLGAPLAADTSAGALQNAILEANALAAATLAGGDRKVLPLLEFSSVPAVAPDVFDQN
jgi:hypothetical protein